ncbi:glycosyl transferase family 4 [Putridiphycobacter roseus]|uniref:Glycosyl transferase family 4 n=1 Tax=Putridiphycobacter roseus TaxID=2219161 RepID=A0A2W1N1I4_9FLAO|nr:glycosyltransferase family 4 protein [Putridiphycobacter roseus]PZE18489.1 glycosyl transferase family 4 [Putridiphycobacter roseus]
MKVLQLCNKPPFPAIDGGCLAIKNISQGLLSANIDLKIISISTAKHPFLIESYTKEFVAATKIESVFVDTRINIVDAFSALVTADSYNVSRFFSPDFDSLLQRTLEESEYDVIHLESLFMTPYLYTIRRYSKAKVVLRSHNLEHVIWERLANVEKKSAKKVYLKHLSKKLKKYEKYILNEVDGIAAISFDDSSRYEKLKCKVPLVTIPFGIDLSRYQLIENQKEIDFFHIGAMNWSPNVEGVNWFLDDILPLIKRKSFRLHLAGIDMPKYLIHLKDERVVNHGEVPSANDFINKHQVMLVPLLSGSGMRIKIIEAMALGKTVITTSIGAEGIEVTENENILIADTPAAFKEKIEDLIDHPEKALKIGTNARKLVVAKYDTELIMKKLIQFYQTL